MAKKTKYNLQAVNLLKEIVKKYPNQLLSTHLSIIFADYANIDGISDKQIFDILEEYKCEKDLDLTIPHSTDIEKIVEEGMDLDSLFSNDEDEEDF